MSKWSSLAGGLKPIPEVSDLKGFGSFLFPVVVLFIIVGIAVMAAQKTVPVAPEAVATVIKAVAVPEVVQEIVDAVKPKFTTVSKYWTTEQSSHDFSEIQQFSEDGYTFNDFQKSFTGRENYSMERPEQKNLDIMRNQLEPMRENLKKSGKSLQQYVDENGLQVPESLFDTWKDETATKVVNAKMNFTEDELSIAREALQIVPTNEENAIYVLREIQVARNEASESGMTLPEMPEQTASLKYWSKQTGTASTIAQSILSRL